MSAKDTFPALHKNAFACPRCNVYALQRWAEVKYGGRGHGFSDAPETDVHTCDHCGQRSWWVGGRMVDPAVSSAPPPHADMPQDVAEDYQEARRILLGSPRGTCALLRLGVQKLCAHLGESGKNINDDIAALVKRGLLPQVQQSLDFLRVVGNNAVHPGQLDLKDDEATALHLFSAMNLIVEQLISAPKHAEALYGSLPQGSREAIEKRDHPGA